MTDYSELKRLADAATPGPWSHDSGSLFFDEGDGPTHMMSVEDGAELGPEQQDMDLNFIAAANPAAVLGLIAENDKLLKLINRMIDQCVPLVECEGLPGYSRVVELVEVVAERDQLKAVNFDFQLGKQAADEEIARLNAEAEELRKDAERYRWICDNACDLNFYASGINNDGPGDCRPIVGRVEIDQGQYPVGEFGSAKAALDSQIDAAMSKEAGHD